MMIVIEKGIQSRKVFTFLYNYKTSVFTLDLLL